MSALETRLARHAVLGPARGRGVGTVAYVPDAGHARVIELAHAEESIAAVPLTTEEEGIGYIAGAGLGGLAASS